MKKKMIYLPVFLAFALLTSCKKEAQSENSTAVQTEEHQGKEISSEFDGEIDKLVSQMTLEEKIGMLHGNSMFSTGAVERLGIPE
jgi:beta-glucosidase